MARPVTCFQCKEKLEKVDAISQNKKNFHPSCLEEFNEKQQQKLQAKHKKRYACPFCELIVDENDEDKKLHQGSYYHLPCYTEKTTGAIERRVLIDFIDLKLKEEGSKFGEHLELVKRIKELNNEPFNYTCKRIKYVLEYILDNYGHIFDTVNCFKGMVKLVPEFEKESIEHYYKNKENEKSVTKLVGDGVPFVTKVSITIKTPRIDKRNFLEVVDMNSIGTDNDEER